MFKYDALDGVCTSSISDVGSQVIVTGDFCQLPPVKPFQHCITCGMDLKPDSRLAYACPKCGKRWEDSEKWAFQSQAWQECQFEHIHLKTIHRQNDKVFIKMLQKCRLGIPFSTEEERVLMYHKTTKSANAVKLFSTRDEVRRTNDTQYQKLRDIECVFQSHDLFRWEAETGPGDFLYPMLLRRLERVLLTDNKNCNTRARRIPMGLYEP